MDLIPAFELGVWNAWLLMIWFVLPPILLNLTRKGRASFKRLTGSVPVKYEKLMNLTSTTVAVVGVFYSIFLPLKLGTIWLYIGLGVFIIGLIIISRYQSTHKEYLAGERAPYAKFEK